MVFVEIMPELRQQHWGQPESKGLEGAVRQGRETHNRVNICLKYRNQRGRHQKQFRCQRKGQTVERVRELSRTQNYESLICNFKIPGHKHIFNNGSQSYLHSRHITLNAVERDESEGHCNKRWEMNEKALMQNKDEAHLNRQNGSRNIEDIKLSGPVQNKSILNE